MALGSETPHSHLGQNYTADYNFLDALLADSSPPVEPP